MEETWFGGDELESNVTDFVSGPSSLFSGVVDDKDKKPKKRWWSAYLLIYEKVLFIITYCLWSS